AVVQIDHTRVDIVLVDDRTRQPIGRPWLTLAVDVFSRMVAGYYLSFDDPSVTSVGLCMAHAILPKEEWLIMHDVEAEWPVWGFPAKVHVDNGPDFQADDFKRSCAMYGIDVDFRPVRTPRYGGHIERLLGTLMKEVHGLPGTTFSSVPHKGEYDSDKHAALTMAEFEKWLVHFICKVYHESLHRGIGMAPIQKWKQGIFGHAGLPGSEVPSRPSDRHTVLLDFMPSFKRTVQRTGVEIEGLKYYAEALRPWINYVDPVTGGKKKFLFRRDPRDVTVIWFRDPDLEGYVKVPVADQSLPPMSLWEYREIRARLKQQGISRASSLDLAHAHKELTEIVERASEKTRKARRMAQRRKEHARKKSPAPDPAVVQKPEPQTETQGKKGSSLFGDVDFDAIEPYEEIE
uniref:Mu transposase C-terminal domain-containing protein n=1 Tax=Alcanivorax sp. TaxID=1872427 RepID=UPI002585DEB3